MELQLHSTKKYYFMCYVHMLGPSQVVWSKNNILSAILHTAAKYHHKQLPKRNRSASWNMLLPHNFHAFRTLGGARTEDLRSTSPSRNRTEHPVALIHNGIQRTCTNS